MQYSHWSSRSNSRRMAMSAAGAVLFALCVHPARAQQKTAVRQSSTTENWSAVEQTLGRKGAMNPGGVMKFSFPRSDLQVMLGDVQLTPSLALGGWVAFKPLAGGKATAINFQPTGGGKAAITGDFVLIGSEVNPVLRTLRENGIQVTAVHSHMLQESPRLFFMHFWANDDATKLASGLHAALARTNSKRS